MHFILIPFILFSQSSPALNRTYDEVLALLTPKLCTLKKENLFLGAEDRKKIEKASGTKLYGGLALRYSTKCPSKKVKTYHYVDSHIVRTLNETVIISIENNKLKKFTVSSFNEPPEYIAPSKWYRQFQGLSQGKVVKLREQIDALSGATLTANASINVVNKTLALHKYLETKNESP